MLMCLVMEVVFLLKHRFPSCLSFALVKFIHPYIQYNYKQQNYFLLNLVPVGWKLAFLQKLY